MAYIKKQSQNDNKKFISVNFKLNENEKNNQCDNDVIEVWIFIIFYIFIFYYFIIFFGFYFVIFLILFSIIGSNNKV